MAPRRKRIRVNPEARDEWTIEEQLCLASSVLKSGDYKWSQISQFMESFLQEKLNRPRDWYSQKCCVIQYAHLMETVDVPKTNQSLTKNTTDSDIVKKLTEKRKEELNLLLASQRDEYQQLKYELNMIQTGNLTEEELQEMCHQIELEDPNPKQEQKRKAPTVVPATSQEQIVQAPKMLEYVNPKESPSSDPDKLDPNKNIMEEYNDDDRSILGHLLRSESPQREISEFYKMLHARNLGLQNSPEHLPGSNLNLQVVPNDEINTIIENFEELTINEKTDNPQVLSPEYVGVKDRLISGRPLVSDKQKIIDVSARRNFSDSLESYIDMEEMYPSSSNIPEIIEIEDFPVKESEFEELIRIAANRSPIIIEGFENEEDWKLGFEEFTEREPGEESLDLMKDFINSDLKVSIEETRVGMKSEEYAAFEDPHAEIEEAKREEKFDIDNTIPSFVGGFKKYNFRKREEAAKDGEKNEEEDKHEYMLKNLEMSPYKKLKLTFEKKWSEDGVTLDAEEVDDNEEVDRLELELNLEKKTGEENPPSSTEVLNLLSHDPLHVEDSEESQEIIWILRNANPELGIQKRVTNEEDLATVSIEDGAESLASSKRYFTIFKEESKKDEMEDFPDQTLIAEIIVDDFKDLEEEEEVTEGSDPLKEIEDLQSEDNIFMDKDIKIELPKEEVCEETSSHEEMKELKDEKKLTLKRSRRRGMKTCSKKTTAEQRDSEVEGNEDISDHKSWKKAIMLVYDMLTTSKYSSVFSKPITEDQASGYSSIVFRPMDLTTIKKNIDNGTIRTTKHFQRDVMLMCQNALIFNKCDSPVYNMAISMQNEFLENIKILEHVSDEVSCVKKRRCTLSSRSTRSSQRNKRSKLVEN